MCVFDRCHSREKRRRADESNNCHLFGSFGGRKKICVRMVNLEIRYLTRTRARKETRPKHRRFATLHVSVFDENSTDRNRTSAPIDPCQFCQNWRRRDRYTEQTNQRFQPFFKYHLPSDGHGRTDGRRTDGHDNFCTPG